MQLRRPYLARGCSYCVLQNESNCRRFVLTKGNGEPGTSVPGASRPRLAIRRDANSVYRFMFVNAAKDSQALSEGYRRTTYSFRKLSAGEAAEFKPLRLRIHKVQAGETPASIAERMPFDSFQLERFLVLNGLAPNAALSPGQEVKTIRQ